MKISVMQAMNVTNSCMQCQSQTVTESQHHRVISPSDAADLEALLI